MNISLTNLLIFSTPQYWLPSKKDYGIYTYSSLLLLFENQKFIYSYGVKNTIKVTIFKIDNRRILVKKNITLYIRGRLKTSTYICVCIRLKWL